MEDTPRLMPLFELSYDKSVRSRSLMTRTFCSSEPQSLINLNCEPQSIVEFYCDDDINHQTQWGFLDNDQEKHFLDDKEEKSGDFKYSDNIFLSMSGCESFWWGENSISRWQRKSSVKKNSPDTIFRNHVISRLIPLVPKNESIN